MFSCLHLGLGAFLVERSFFPENERNDQEQSHCFEKKERLEHVLKNIGTISNGNCLKRMVKIANVFLLSRTCSKLGTHFKSWMCSKSSRNSSRLFYLITWPPYPPPTLNQQSPPLPRSMLNWQHSDYTQTIHSRFQFNFSI